MKKASMEVGQVGFHDDKNVKKTKVAKRINAIVNRLNKTKVEDDPNLQALKEKYEREMREKERNRKEAERRKAKEEEEERQRDKEMRSYDTLYRDDALESNADVEMTAEEFEEDFM